MAGKKKKGKGKIFFWICFLLFLFLIWMYLDFEFQKINYAGGVPLKDWRSFASYFLSKVPYFKKKVEYSPKYILPLAQQYELEVGRLNAYFSKLNEEIKVKEDKLSEKEKELKEKEQQLKLEKARYNSDLKALNAEKARWEDYNMRLNKLAQWMSNADASKIVGALKDKSISATDIASAFLRMDDSAVGDILQSLATVDPTKAAAIISHMSKPSTQ
ncbi:MAG: hypothetical protein DRP50_00440 [Thermotoga sp.]|nr:MAG: hypothetical protein DRP50_00440 [Thermotoga sp.]